MNVLNVISGSVWAILCVSFGFSALKGRKDPKTTFELQYYKYLLTLTSGMLSAILLVQGLMF